MSGTVTSTFDKWDTSDHFRCQVDLLDQDGQLMSVLDGTTFSATVSPPDAAATVDVTNPAKPALDVYSLGKRTVSVVVVLGATLADGRVMVPWTLNLSGTNNAQVPTYVQGDLGTATNGPALAVPPTA